MAVPHSKSIHSTAKLIKETQIIHKIDAITHENHKHYFEILTTLFYRARKNHAFCIVRSPIFKVVQ